MLKELVDILSGQDEYAIDLETSGLDPLSDTIIGISFACGGDADAWYIPFSGEKAFSRLETFDALRPIFLDESKIAIFFNGKFDLKFLKRSGIEFRNRIADVQIAAWLLDENRMYETKYFSLKTLALLDLGITMKTYEQVVEEFGTESDEFAEYGKDDSRRTLQLWELYLPQIENQGLEKIFWEMKMPMVDILADMELTGIKLDCEYLMKVKKDLAKKLIPIQDKIYKLAGKEFLVSSSQQVGEVLFKDLNIPHDGILVGKSGKISTEEKYLKPLKKKNKIVKLILEWRGISKILSTYTDKFVKRVKEDGRIHANFHQVRTVTGRLSSSDPNMQNISKDPKIGIRKSFTCDDGHVLICGDLSQIELRIMAHRSKDWVMTDAYSRGADLHQTMADNAHVSRDDAKGINFGFLYGMGAKKFSEKYDHSLQKSYRFRENFFEVYSRIKFYHQKVYSQALKTGMVKTICGRPRRFDTSQGDPRGDIFRQSINAVIQGSAADIFDIIMRNYVRELNKKIKEDPRFEDVKPVIQVHDELVVDSPEEIAQVAADMLKSVMENSIKLSVPIVADISMGKTWSEAKE